MNSLVLNIKRISDFWNYLDSLQRPGTRSAQVLIDPLVLLSQQRGQTCQIAYWLLYIIRCFILNMNIICKQYFHYSTIHVSYQNLGIVQLNWGSYKIKFSLSLCQSTCATALSEMGLIRSSSDPSSPPTDSTVDSGMHVVKSLREWMDLSILTIKIISLYWFAPNWYWYFQFPYQNFLGK